MSDLVWTPVKIKLGQIQPWTDNPRMSTKAQAQRLIKSERRLGQIQTLAIGPMIDGKYPLYDGHQRVSSWLTVKTPDFEVMALQSNRPLTDDERREVAVLLHTATGSWDWNALSGWSAADLREWGMDKDTLKGWQSDAKELTELLNSEQAESADAEPQIDRAAELAEKWHTATGQLWRLGDHRLLIGDCTVRENVERLMGGERAEAGFFDPPYGIAFQSNARTASKKFDALKGDTEINGEWIPIAVEKIVDTGAIYICTRWDVYPEWKDLIKPHINIKNLIVLDKVDWSSGDLEGDYSPRHEFIFYCTKGRHILRGGRDSNVWNFGAINKQDYLHPTQKKVEVPQMAFSKSSDKNSIVIDFFAGSGTTIIAAHNLNRRCYAMEISEKYGAVILERFFIATGIAPELVE